MSKYSRYLFVKKLYPEYVVFIKDKDLLKTFDYDLKIVEIKGLDSFLKMKVNYIILDNLDITYYDFNNNNYFYYFKIVLVYEVIRLIKLKI